MSRWKNIVSESEAKGCIVDSKPFKEATNSFAVRNLLFHMHRERKVKVADPPENKQMRYGFYKSALLFIGMFFKFAFFYPFHTYLLDAKAFKRQPLSSCVMAMCRKSYPSSDGQYVGFKKNITNN